MFAITFVIYNYRPNEGQAKGFTRLQFLKLEVPVCLDNMNLFCERRMESMYSTNARCSN